MSKLKYTIVQKGGAFHMSEERPIHFILHGSSVLSADIYQEDVTTLEIESSVGLAGMIISGTGIPDNTQVSNVPGGKQIELSIPVTVPAKTLLTLTRPTFSEDITNLLKNANVPEKSKIEFSGITLPHHLDNWTQNGNTLICKKKGENNLYFYELIELVKKKYEKYNWTFNSELDFKYFFNENSPSPASSSTSIVRNVMLTEYILRNIDVYVEGEKKVVSVEDWVSLMKSYFMKDLEIYKQEIDKHDIWSLLQKISFLKKEGCPPILLIGEIHLYEDHHIKFSNQRDIIENLFLEILYNIINKYIIKFENTNFFLENDLIFGKSRTNKTKYQIGGAVLNNIRDYFKNDKTLKWEFNKSKIHYTDIRSFNIIGSMPEIDFKYEKNEKIWSHIVIAKTNSLCKVLDDFIDLIYFKIVRLHRKTVSRRGILKSKNYTYYNIKNVIYPLLKNINELVEKDYVKHNDPMLIKIINYLPEIFTKVFETFSLILNYIKKKNEQFYITVFSNISKFTYLNRLSDFFTATPNTQTDFNNKMQSFYLNKRKLQINNNQLENSKILIVLAEIKKITEIITKYYYNFLMDIYTVQRILKYSTETPSIYYAGLVHIKNCIDLLKISGYEEHIVWKSKEIDEIDEVIQSQ
ncbi:hypothetical protein N9T73_00310 [bacterium]|nr:hypothetical protein [bacterium]